MYDLSVRKPCCRPGRGYDAERLNLPLGYIMFYELTVHPALHIGTVCDKIVHYCCGSRCSHRSHPKICFSCLTSGSFRARISFRRPSGHYTLGGMARIRVSHANASICRERERVCLGREGSTQFVPGRSRMAVDHRPSHPYYTGTEHVGFSPTRQTLLAPKRSAVKLWVKKDAPCLWSALLGDVLSSDLRAYF